MPTARLVFPWSYGVVLTHITRRQFEAAGLDQAIAPQRVMCSDEMTSSVDAEDFQSRLWGMFPTLMRGVLSLPQIDRVRWILFPEVRVGTCSQGPVPEPTRPRTREPCPTSCR
jgi:hypothetical protein